MVRIKNNVKQKPKVRENRERPHPSRGSHDRMSVENDKSFSRFLCHSFQSQAQFQILTGKGLVTETAEFRKTAASIKINAPESSLRHRNATFTTDVTSSPTICTWSQRMVAPPAIQSPDWISLAMSANNPALGWESASVNTSQSPLATAAPEFRARAIWLTGSTRRCAHRPRDFRRAVVRIVVTDDQFSFPAELREWEARRLDLRECFAQEFFLIEGWHDDGHFHCPSVAGCGKPLQVQMVMTTFDCPAGGPSRIHPGGMKEGNRGSRPRETPELT